MAPLPSAAPITTDITNPSQSRVGMSTAPTAQPATIISIARRPTRRMPAASRMTNVVFDSM